MCGAGPIGADLFAVDVLKMSGPQSRRYFKTGRLKVTVPLAGVIAEIGVALHINGIRSTGIGLVTRCHQIYPVRRVR